MRKTRKTITTALLAAMLAASACLTSFGFYQEPESKKGILVSGQEPELLQDIVNLGCKQAICNLASYQNVNSFDPLAQTCRSNGLTLTMILLNNFGGNPDLLPVSGPVEGTGNYAFNVSTAAGEAAVRAYARNVAGHYSNTVSNWVIGNEINNQYWNYMGGMGLDQYVKEYERAFRVFYTAIKSTSANDRVYFSTDYHWNYNANGTTKYNAKDFIEKFNANVRAGGQIDWNLAYHPYSVPTGLVTQSEDSPIVNIANLSVLTDFLQKPEFLNASGQVRHVILSEQGYTSTSATRGKCEELQAAAIAYAYYIADSNPYIDAFIMSRQVDAPSEAKLSASFGLYECDMGREDRISATRMKKSYEVYRAIDKSAKTLEATQFAKELIGIDHWYDVIPDFRWKGQEMRTQN